MERKALWKGLGEGTLEWKRVREELWNGRKEAHGGDGEGVIQSDEPRNPSDLPSTVSPLTPWHLFLWISATLTASSAMSSQHAPHPHRVDLECALSGGGGTGTSPGV
eukprot:358523-Chlamydomonas_euryale.AAC.3